MAWIYRLTLAIAGLFIIMVAVTQLRAGKVVFDNASYHQQTFAASGIGVGIILFSLAFLPPRDWVYKHITTRKRLPGRKKKHPRR